MKRAGRLTCAVASLLICAAAPCAFAKPPLSIIVDTDAGSDDLMAIAFLLARPDVHLEAITVVNGLAHPRSGAANVLRLLELAGHRGVPVYVGGDMPLRATAPFPEEWRKLSDELPGVHLPAARRKPESQSAGAFLAARLLDKRRPARILALGPLTNLAEAMRRKPAVARNIRELVIMGGAVRVPGNLGDGGYFKTDNTTAEWNIFVDPLAAQIVFSSGAKIRLVPLDATNKVPIDLAFLDELKQKAQMPLARFVAEVLETDRSYIQQGFYYAWDPLAAVAAIESDVAKTTGLAIEIHQKPPEEGRTAEVAGRVANADVGLDADAAAFKRIFLGGLLAARSRQPRRD